MLGNLDTAIVLVELIEQGLVSSSPDIIADQLWSDYNAIQHEIRASCEKVINLNFILVFTRALSDKYEYNIV